MILHKEGRGNQPAVKLEAVPSNLKTQVAAKDSYQRLRKTSLIDSIKIVQS